MMTAITKIKDRTKAALGILRQLGPWLIAQSDAASEGFAKHKTRLAIVEAGRSLMLNEIETMSQIRKNLTQRYFDAAPEDRLRLRADLDETERQVRKLGIYQLALEQIESQPEDSSECDEEGTSTATEISPHWMDKFDEFAKAQNEAWRQDLLANALALEASDPGSFGPRALWMIGTIDEPIFHAYAAVLDISSVIGGAYMIPSPDRFVERPIPTCSLGGHDSGLPRLMFLLDGLGLLGHVGDSNRELVHPGSYMVSYGSRVSMIKTKGRIDVAGIIPTALGRAIAALYPQQPNLLGQEIFDTWLASLAAESATVTHQS